VIDPEVGELAENEVEKQRCCDDVEPATAYPQGDKIEDSADKQPFPFVEMGSKVQVGAIARL